MRRQPRQGTDETPTLGFDEFWDWLIRHPNCILRAGTRDSVIYDDDDYHWHFAVEAPDTPLVQVIRGKRLVGELFISRDDVAYVQGSSGDVEGEHVFDLMLEAEVEHAVAYFFVLSHGYEGESALEPPSHSVH